jgi:DNA-binding winged helix-turn-helix (wHTH) protein/tetratricopeptide (TPR) repeat protein
MADRYVFDGFWLDLRARELHHHGEHVVLAVVAFDCLAYLVQHRDRPVGRDELISAVWGRTDVSESTLAHTVVRLRQVLGDTGSEQRCIRTVPRLGYRWVKPLLDADAPAVDADPASPEDVGMPAAQTASSAPSEPAREDAAVASASPVAGTPSGRTVPAARSGGWARALVAAVVLACVVALVAWLRQRTEAPSAAALVAAPTAMQAALVEPAGVTASSEWSWLRLGMMDLVANRFREGRLPTVPSETALSLTQRGGEGFPPGVTMRVRPTVVRESGDWRVALDGRFEDGRRVRAEARGADVMQATRLAADRLLMQLGRPAPRDALAAEDHVGVLLQRVAAARLAGHLDEALSLLSQASPAWRERPDLRVLEARILCDLGRIDACADALVTLAADESDDWSPKVRADLRMTQAWLLINRDLDFEAAEQRLDGVLAMREALGPSDVLGNAHSLRGWVRYATGRTNEALADFGAARTLFLRTGNLREIARVDQRMGTTLAEAGQLSRALASLRVADRQFENLGAHGDQTITLMSMAQVHAQLLEHDEALAATERYWSRQKTHDPGSASFRAWALMRKGRLSEAEALIAPLIADRTATEAVSAGRADALALAARIAFARGQLADAARLAGEAATPALEHVDPVVHFDNGMLRLRALRASGQAELAQREAARLLAWAGPRREPALAIGRALLRAEQALHAGRTQAAMTAYAEALDAAEAYGVPDRLVETGASYAHALIATGRTDEAGVVVGRLAAWTQADVRAAAVQARLLRALGNAAEADLAEREAQRLAGEGRP